MNRIGQIGFSDPMRTATATVGLVSHGSTEARSEYQPAEDRPVGAAMGGVNCVAGAMRGEARSEVPTWQVSVTPYLRVRKYDVRQVV